MTRKRHDSLTPDRNLDEPIVKEQPKEPRNIALKPLQYPQMKRVQTDRERN